MRLSKADRQNVVSNAIDNAITTVFIEKAMPVSDVEYIARESIYDSISGSYPGATVTPRQIAAMQAAAASGAAFAAMKLSK